MANLTPEQQRLLAIATARQAAAGNPPATTGGQPDPWAILAEAGQRPRQEMAIPLAIPDRDKGLASVDDFVAKQYDELPWYQKSWLSVVPGQEPSTKDKAKIVADLRAGERIRREARDADRPLFGINDVVHKIGSGVMAVGPYLDEADAATNAWLAPYVDPLIPDSWGTQKLPEKDWQGRYDHALAIQRGIDRRMDLAAPITAEAASLAGNIMSGGALLRGAPTVGKYVLGDFGTTIPQKLLASSVAGAGVGAVEGFGNGEGGLMGRLNEASKEALKGGLENFGLTGAGIGRAKLISYLRRKILGEGAAAMDDLTTGARKGGNTQPPGSAGW
jgi:hypothetical protein